ncbi:hypothetical protein [Vibrio sp. 10N.286.49.B3]|uniref:hypothetical protein n=1 Tax=Vibrio sp. 10N.286.49.B3 TaxID=1880855 RepID=UPI0012FFF7C3|nr:hypothetical protein [Vibrio sp. 10N.286.49.B3]
MKATLYSVLFVFLCFSLLIFSSNLIPSALSRNLPSENYASIELSFLIIDP